MVSLTVVALISLIFICVGDVNFLAPIVTMPFLITYIAVDYAYFALAITADVNAATAKLSISSSSCSNQSLKNLSVNEDSNATNYGSISEDSQPTDATKLVTLST